MPLWKQDLLTLTVQTVVKGVHIAQCSILCLVEYFFIFVLSIELLVLGITACDYRFDILRTEHCVKRNYAINAYHICCGLVNYGGQK
jgi:hypothetical protein